MKCKDCEYCKEHLCGVNIDCFSSKNGKNTINPYMVESEEIVPLDKTYPLDAHIRLIEDFLTIQNVDFETIDIIKEVILNEYEKRGMTSDTTTLEFINKFKNEDYPLCSDIHDQLVKIQKKAEEEKNKVRVEYLEKAIIFIRPLLKEERKGG